MLNHCSYIISKHDITTPLTRLISLSWWYRFYCKDTVTQEPCPKGAYCLSRSVTPRLCPVGTYRDTTGGVVVASCDPCPLYTSTASEGATSLDACLCSTGYYTKETTTPDVTTNTGGAEQHGDACVKCIENVMVCDEVVMRIENIKAAPGYWRVDPYTINFIQCPYGENACGNSSNSTQGGNGTGNCKIGHEGFLCAMCADGKMLSVSLSSHTSISESACRYFILK